MVFLTAPPRILKSCTAVAVIAQCLVVQSVQAAGLQYVDRGHSSHASASRTPVERRTTPSSDAFRGVPLSVAQASAQAAPSATPAAQSAADAAILATVAAWAQAWSARDVERYLAFYAPAFKPPQGQTREAWEASRRARVTGPSSIQVSISDLKVLRRDAARAAASFRQAYRSDRYQDDTHKTLELVQDGERWLIVEERIASSEERTGAAAVRQAQTRVSADLGEIRVLSALGQPLRAEVDLGAPGRGEQEDPSVRLASPEDFQRAGIEFNPALAGVNVSIQQRDGTSIIAVTTRDPVNEPFLEMLIALERKSGRLVRKYTLLLDPPTYLPPPPAGAVIGPTAPSAAVPIAKPVTRAAPSAPSSAAAPVRAPRAAPAPTISGADYVVAPGDTLARIAAAHLHADVTLDQMLLALYRTNSDAFIDDNINLLRAGHALKIPERTAVATVDPAQAKDAVRALMADPAAQRRAIAATAPTAAGTESVRAGETTAPVPAPAGPKGEVKLSRTEPGKPDRAAAATADDRAARERELKEAQSRIEELEKTVAEIHKLIALRNQQIAELEKRAAAKPAPAVAPVAKPAVEPPKPAVEPPKPAVEPPKPAVEPPKPAVEAPKPAPAKPTPVPAPKPAAKPRPVPPPPAPEPGLFDEIVGDPLMLGGLGGVFVLLVAYAAYAWRKKKRRAAQAQITEGLLGAAAAGASALDAPAVADAEAGAAAAEASEEVDPIAEADVFMAYGRDVQAEAILREALHRGASGAIVYSKLLPIYAKRHDTKQFEATAIELRGLVDDTGPEWAKAMALGRSIDPDNALYGRGEPANTAPEVDLSETPEVDFDLDAIMGPGQTQTEGSEAGEAPGVDFDIDTTANGTRRAAEIDMTIDFDLGGTTTEKPVAAEPAASGAGNEPARERGGLDFDLGGATSEQPAAAETVPAAEQASPDAGGGRGFELSLDMDGEQAPAPGDTPAPAAVGVDLAAISFDMDAGESAGASASGAAAKSQEVETKLHLAKSYAEIGDSDGARELLNEVVAEGDAAQQAKAQEMLASLE